MAAFAAAEERESEEQQTEVEKSGGQAKGASTAESSCGRIHRFACWLLSLLVE